MPNEVRFRHLESGRIAIGPADMATPEGFERLESRGPFREAVDAASGALSSARDATQRGINRTARNVMQTGTPMGSATGEPFQSDIGNAVAGAINPVPGSLPDAALLATQIATAPAGVAARLVGPPLATGAASLLTGETPMQAAARTGVALGGQAAGEAIAGAGNYLGRKVSQRTTTGANEAGMARDAATIAAGAREILPHETAPFLQQGTPDELLRMRDPNALVQQMKLGKQLADQEVVSALRGKIYQVGDQQYDAAEALSYLKELKAEVREMERQKRIGTTEYNPLAAKDYKDKVGLRNSLETSLRRDLDAIGAGEVRAKYDESNRMFGTGMDLLDFLEAAQKQTGTTGQTFTSAEDLRKYLMQNRQFYPEATHGPLYDRIQLGRGDVPGYVELPNLLSWAAPVPSRLKTLDRVGAPAPAQMPPALLDILFGRLLHSLTPGQ